MKIVLWLLAIPNILTGLWAILAPQNWFDTFPGWAPAVVAAHPPFNAHLATDAGAGLLTLGVISLSAVILGRRDAVLVAGAGALAFAGPHALYHLFNPADALTTSENISGTGSLVLTALGAAAVLIGAVRLEGGQA